MHVGSRHLQLKECTVRENNDRNGSYKTHILPFTTCECQTQNLYTTEINEFYVENLSI